MPQILKQKKICSRGVLLLLLILSFAVYPQEQDLQFVRFGIKDGMSANSTLAILQDSKGFMWLGSQNGLNRYDGNHFKIFHNDPDDSNSISDSYIFNLSEDKFGGIWICAGEGLNRYDRLTGKFTRFNIDSASASQNKISRITAVLCDSDSLIWFGTSNGRIFKLHQNFINRNDRINIWLKALKSSAILSESWITSIYESSNKERWIADIEGNIAVSNPAEAVLPEIKFKKYSSFNTGIISANHHQTVI